MDASTYAQFVEEERGWDLKGLSGERFLRQLHLAHSLGLLGALLAEAERQNSRQASRFAASEQSAAVGSQPSSAL